MRPTRLAVAIILIAAGNLSFNAAAQSAPSAKDIAEMKAQIAALQAQIQNLEERSQELETRNDAQSEVNVAQAKTNEQLDDVAALKKLVNDTKISGRMYYDLTNIDDKNHGVKTDKSGFAFDIKRFYLGVDHKFDDVWSMNLTTDFQYSSAISSTEPYSPQATAASIAPPRPGPSSDVMVSISIFRMLANIFFQSLLFAPPPHILLRSI